MFCSCPNLMEKSTIVKFYQRLLSFMSPDFIGCVYKGRIAAHYVRAKIWLNSIEGQIYITLNWKGQNTQNATDTFYGKDWWPVCSRNAGRRRCLHWAEGWRAGDRSTERQFFIPPPVVLSALNMCAYICMRRDKCMETASVVPYKGERQTTGSQENIKMMHFFRWGIIFLVTTITHQLLLTPPPPRSQYCW